MSSKFVTDLWTHVRAGYPVLAINSSEEVRCLNQIKRAGWMMAHERKISPNEIPPRLALRMQEKLGISIERDWKVGSKVELNSEPIIELMEILSTSEEQRDQDDGKEVANFLDRWGYPTYQWDQLCGFDPTPKGSNTDAFSAALEMIAMKDAFLANCLLVFKDVHSHLNSTETPVYRRALRNLAETTALVNLKMRRIIILLQPDWIPHKDIDHCVASVKFDLPDVDQLDGDITYLQSSILGAKPTAEDREKARCEPALRSQVRHALRGFTQIESMNALYYCLAKHRKFEEPMLRTIYQLKASALGKDNVLEIIDETKIRSFNNFGGFENYFDFINEVRACYTEQARSKGIKRPKGCTIVGIPGTGKSMVAMATAKELQLPLIKFNLSAVYGSLVGQSESNMNMALRRIKAQGPAVVLIDEADKAVSGVVSSASSGDSGVSRRVFGSLLSWMANDNEEAFIIMTMNRTLGVPPETLRAGRLDATFYTTFPTDQDREEILKIHLGLNGVDYGKLFNRSEWNELVELTKDFVGAELEQLVLKAIRVAFRETGDIVPSMKNMKDARLTVSPMAQIDKEGIAEINRWCEDKAIPVSHKKTKARAVEVPVRRSLGNPSDN